MSQPENCADQAGLGKVKLILPRSDGLIKADKGYHNKYMIINKYTIINIMIT